MMSTKDSSANISAGIDPESDSAQRWPQFSEQELRRLEFVVYLRQTGRISPVRAETDRAVQRTQFSRQELRRLAFVRHLRQTGRIPPASPVPAELDALYASLLSAATPPAPRPAAPHSPECAPSTSRARRNVRGGIPLTWAVYAEKYGTRRL
jgi:hypothetical protein